MGIVERQKMIWFWDSFYLLVVTRCSFIFFLEGIMPTQMQNTYGDQNIWIFPWFPSQFWYTGNRVKIKPILASPLKDRVVQKQDEKTELCNGKQNIEHWDVRCKSSQNTINKKRVEELSERRFRYDENSRRYQP